MSAHDTKIMKLADEYRSLAVEILREAIRIPADHVDRPADQGGDPLCGLSNHEGPRLEYLKRRIVEIGAVAAPEHVDFDGFGNLIWTVEDDTDGIPPEEKTVVYFDGHTDTVKALRDRWHEAVGGMDPYLGITDPDRIDKNFLRSELGYLPPEEEWDHLVWGRGAADQLSGVVCQIIATKILNELRGEGLLRGVIVRSYATVAEEDNDGGALMYLRREVLPKGGAELVPDAIILTEGTGDAGAGAVGIYRGQRGRMQIEVEVTGKSCHGSMPWEGRNPLEFGAAIIVEASEAYGRGDGFGGDDFLGPGTRTASWAQVETPSDCAVPERFTFRFDRRLTAGEDPTEAQQAVESFASVTRAREAGLRVEVRAPIYNEPSWKGHQLGNPQIYPGWVTPEDHPVVRAAVEAYRGVASPGIADGGTGGQLRKEPRVARWIFSTDGVGMPARVDELGFAVPERKGWVVSGNYTWPPMLGIGPGHEQNTHKVGENVDSRDMVVTAAILAAFPGRLRGSGS